MPSFWPEGQAANREEMAMLRAAIKRLPEQMRIIVQMRLQGRILDEVGTYYGITRERVRQIEEQAHELLREMCVARCA